MKRKFLSTLLMGALFIASVSVLTSCKDYDDDINQLQQDVAQLKSSLNTQIEQLKGVQQECEKNCSTSTARLSILEQQLSSKYSKEDVDKAIAAALANYLDKGAVENLDAELLAAAKSYCDTKAEEQAEAARLAAVKEAKEYAEELRDKLNDTKLDKAAFTAELEKLNGTIGGIDERLTTVEGLVDGHVGAIENLTIQVSALEGFKKAIEEKFGVELAELETLKNSLQEKLDELKNTLTNEYKGYVDEAVKKLREELAEGEGIKAYDDTELRERLKALEEAAGDFTDEEVSKLKELLNTLNKEVIENLNNATQDLNVLQLFIEKQVTSIVLKPEFYYSGIEAIELPALYDAQYTATNALVVERNEDGEVTKIETWTQRQDLAMVDICNGGVAYYHVNPYSADWVGGKVDFLGNLPQTRAGNPEQNYENLLVPTPAVLTKEDNAVQGYAGLIKVPFTGSFESVNSLLKANTLPMVALHYTKDLEEKVNEVSSDWALVAPTQYKDLLIANNPDVTKYYTTTPHEGFNFGQEEDPAALGVITFTANGKEESRVNPTTGHYTRLLEELTADSIPGTYQLKYDSVFNLNSFVETHYTYSYRNSAGVEVKNADKKLDPEVFAKFGLHYEFDIVSYKSGNNATDEAAHIAIEKDEKTGEYIGYFVQVNEDGTRTKATTDWGHEYAQAGKASVGRMPVVRVIIKDESGKVVSYAYIKLEIVEEAPADEPIVEETVDFTYDGDKVYMDCDLDDAGLTLTWSQIENKILINALNNEYSKNSFEDKWTLVGYDDVIANVLDGTEGEANQYETTDATKILPTNNTPKLGVVQLVEDPKAAHMQVLQWWFSTLELYSLFALKDARNEPTNQLDPEKVDFTSGESKIALETYVLLDGPKKIWVKFIIPKGAIVFATGSINDNKTKTYWFDLNSTEKNVKAEALRLKETRANVTVPNTQNDDCAFEWDLLSAFDEAKVAGTIKNQKNFPSFANADVTFTFTTPSSKAPKNNAEFDAANDGTWTVSGNSGSVYTVKVGDNAECIVATKKGNTAINPVDTIVAFKEEGSSVLVYKDNETALDILNKPSRPDQASTTYVNSKQTFTAYLKLTVAACYELIINDGSDYVNVKFLRPVEVLKAKDATMQDGKDDGDVVNVMDLVSLVDWRFQSFTSTNGITDKDTDANGVQQADVNYVKYDNPHYVNYYGVSIDADVENALTDINQANPKAIDPSDDAAIANAKLVNLKKNSPNVTFTFTPADITYDTKAKKLVGGTIFYQNINGNTSDFHIYVPITLTYKWGNEVNCGYALITVKGTQNQGLAK